MSIDFLRFIKNNPKTTVLTAGLAFISLGVLIFHPSQVKNIKAAKEITAVVKPTITPTQAPTPTVERIPAPTSAQPASKTDPTIDCTGPDGKHLQVTQKQCDDFNK